jgi:hypothetical protein
MHKFVFAVFALILTESAFAQSLEGQYVMDGKKIAISHVTAFRIRDGFNARNFETLVLLTPMAINQEAIKNSYDPYTTLINDPSLRGADYVQLSVHADNVVSINGKIGGVQYLDTSGKMMGQTGSLKATCGVNTAEHVRCEVATIKPVKSMDGPTWETKLSFDAPVLSRTRGTALPTGGGEVGKALLTIAAAHKAKNKAVLLAQLSAEDAADYSADWRTPEENLKALVERFDWSLPKKPKVIGGEQVDAQTVLLEVEGVPYDGGKMLYLVEMHNVDGTWRFASNTTLGMLK